MRKIEEFVKEHELKTLSSQEGELLAEGMTGGVRVKTFWQIAV